MKKKENIIAELLRKSIHLSGLLLVLGYTLILNYYSKGFADLALIAVLLLILEIEHIRIEHKPNFAKVFNQLFRHHEKDSIAGSVFFVISCIMCFAVFDYWIAVLAMFMTVFGDLFAALIGKSFGRYKFYKNKTILGTLAGLTANISVGFLVLPELAILVLPMAFIATATEVITNKLDDNLTVPLFAGFAGQLIVKFLELDLPGHEFTIPGIF